MVDTDITNTRETGDAACLRMLADERIDVVGVKKACGYSNLHEGRAIARRHLSAAQLPRNYRHGDPPEGRPIRRRSWVMSWLRIFEHLMVMASLSPAVESAP